MTRITLIDKALITDNTPVVRLLDFDDDRIKAWSEVWDFIVRNIIDGLEEMYYGSLFFDRLGIENSKMCNYKKSLYT